MADDKNLFNFGTGNIKRDQWLRDIDNEQDAFISRYTNATNKRKGLLLRLAFAELRKRIGSGDMLGRDDAGSFQFASSLNNEDRGVLEAQLRALGFMAELGRRQIQTPAAEPEKKGIGSLEERYIKSLNPTGKFNTKAYWNSQTDDERRNSLISFLNGELGRVDSYLDFGSFETKDNYKERLNNVLGLLRDSKANDWTLQLLGFTKNWLAKPEEEEEEKKSETDEEVATKAYNDQLTLRKVAQLNNITNFMLLAYPETWYSFSTPLYDSTQFDNMIREAWATGGAEIDKYKNPYSIENAYSDHVGGMPLNFINDYINNFSKNLNDYFGNLSTKYTSMYADDKNKLALNLAYLFRKNKEGKYTYNEMILKYLTPLDDGSFLINGSEDKISGRYARYIPGKGIVEESIGNTYIKRNDLDNIFNITRLKNGGVIKAQYGTALLDFNEDLEETLPKVISLPKQIEAVSELKNPTSGTINGDKKASDMNALDWVGILTPAILDLTSMLSANVPGWGTVASAGTGIASTLWTGIRDWEHSGMGSGLKTLGTGLAADTLGLIPGWGTSAKLGKIAKGLSKYAKYIGPALAAKGLSDAAGVFNKLVTQGGSSLTKDDLNTLVYGLVGLTSKGTAGVKRANRSNLERAAVQQYNVTTRTGKNVTLNAEQLAKLRAQHKVKKATPVVTSDALIEANDLIMSASKWPMFGSVSLDRLEKMLELRLASNRNIFHNTVWKPVRKGLYEEIPAYKPTGLNSQDWGLNILLPTVSKKKSLEKFLSFKENYYKKKEKKEVSSEKYGGVLKALRNGGIIKADDGLKSPVLANPSRQNGYAFEDWANLEFGTDLMHAWDWRDHNRRMGTNLKESYGLYNNDEGKLDLNSARSALYNYHTYNGGNNIMGDVVKYYNDWIAANPGKSYQDFANLYNSDVDWLRNYNRKKLSTEFNTPGWEEFNTRHHRVYGSYGLRDQNGKTYDDWNVKLAPDFGESTMRRVTNSFANAEEYKDKRTGLLSDKDTKSRIFMDNNGHIFLADLSDDGVKEATPGTSGSTGQQTAVDKLDPKASIYNTEFKNPMDPTPFITAGKTALGLFGNKDIYGNLLKEYPHPALQDPLHRQLAIVGNQRIIDDARNKLGDLRKITIQLRGNDSQVNFAKDLETERVGREIFDNAFRLDASRQFDTAQKLWNLKNEDTFTNWRTAYENRKAIENYNKTLAQIRAAWRSGNNNILMGAAADTGNWLMKRFQREQDTVDRARALALGTPEEWAQSEYTSRLGDLANKKASDMTELEKAKAEAIKALVLRDMRLKYSERYYTNFNNGWFGGGYKKKLLGKDGTKLEVEKLKARGKDNDRYVSMIKDLRTTKRRRR